ncbi:MAG TPA: YggS family pyridoxal phosphate-dependent enzyme [Casimicrobiaceae bacterium]|nr:YggS family pyridoxal phosphate-dependent enzyme [Casimicrobiaceae bacterium]
MVSVRKALQDVAARIAAAARAAGRDPAEVTLLAVSKTFPSAVMREAYAAGQRAFGENYVQEGAAKGAELGDLPGLRLVLIGPLQSNKAKLAAEAFDAVETVDRLKIAERLSALRPADRPALDVLVQVNISGEAAKSGCAPGDAAALAQAVARLPRLRLQGFMGIAEATQDEARQREQFARLRRIRDEARAAGLDVPVLSMGMTADMEAAIAEGATEVRVGTAIFGSRAPRVPVDA